MITNRPWAEKVAEFIRRHNFNCAVLEQHDDDFAILIEVPWTRDEGRLTGISFELARSLAEAKQILGY